MSKPKKVPTQAEILLQLQTDFDDATGDLTDEEFVSLCEDLESYVQIAREAKEEEMNHELEDEEEDDED